MNNIKRRKAPKMGIRKQPQIRCPQHLAFVCGHVCAIEGQHYHKTTKTGLVNDTHLCEGKIQAAHVRTGTDGGMSVKPSDIWAIPLCNLAHGEQHSIGEASFEKRYGINMKAIAEQLAARSPHRMKWLENEHT